MKFFVFAYQIPILGQTLYINRFSVAKINSGYLNIQTIIIVKYATNTCNSRNMIHKSCYAVKQSEKEGKKSNNSS